MTAYELAKLWQAWLEADGFWMQQSPESRRLWDTAREANAAVIADHKQYVEEAMKIQRDASAGERW